MTKRSKIREGLHQLSKAEQAQTDALLLQVGKIVVTQSNIENTLALIVFLLCRSMRFVKAMDYFYSVYGFEKRLELTDFLMQKDGPQELLDDWAIIVESLSKHRVTRNLVAHQGISYSINEDRTLQGLLSPPWMRRNKSKGRELTVADLRRSADDFERIHGLVADFARELSKVPPPYLS